ncbi:MAG: polymer-forming cytoskeletal protein [Armatimonadota bacterium]|nr:polymer-forming cytoskeletal protein [Armatimonadota bacterium]
MKMLLATLSCLCAAVIVQSPAAGEFSVAPDVVFPKGETRHEDVFTAAVRTRVEAEVSGDLVAAAVQEARVSAPIDGYVILAGRNVDLGGNVRNDAWLLGQVVTVHSCVMDNAYLAGAAVVTDKRSRVGKDLFAAGGTVSLSGTVGRDVRAAARTLVIDGSVRGNLYAKTNELRLLDHAVVYGNVYCESPNPIWRSTKAKVMGQIIHRLPVNKRAKSVFWSKLGRWFRRLAAAIVFGAVLLAAFPSQTMGAAETVKKSFWQSLGIGFIAAIVVPIASVITLITVIGMPLGLAALAIYAVLLYTSGLFTAYALGTLVTKRFGTSASRLAVLVCGVVLLSIVYELPLLGWAAKLTGVLVGLGAFCLTLLNTLRTSEHADHQPS